MKFEIRNVRGAHESATQTFTSLEEARLALCKALGWADVQLGPGYTAPSTHGQVWCAYRTRREAEADQDGLGVPRIVRTEGDH